MDVTGGDERRVGYYAGLVVSYRISHTLLCVWKISKETPMLGTTNKQESLFFASEALTVLYWSHLSDFVGRRPILLMGFAGLSLSMIGFGLSKTFPLLIIRFVRDFIFQSYGSVDPSLFSYFLTFYW